MYRARRWTTHVASTIQSNSASSATGEKENDPHRFYYSSTCGFNRGLAGLRLDSQQRRILRIHRARSNRLRSKHDRHRARFHRWRYLDMVDDRTVYGFQKCLFCDNRKPLYSDTIVTTIFICDDCRRHLQERNQSHKSSWIPNSKGGEPNCRR